MSNVNLTLHRRLVPAGMKHILGVTLLQCIGKPSASLQLSLCLCVVWLDFSDRLEQKKKYILSFRNTMPFKFAHPLTEYVPMSPSTFTSEGGESATWAPFHLLIYLSSDAPIDKRIIYLLKGLGIICHCHSCLSGNWMCHRVASVLPCLMSQMGALTYVCLTFHAVKWCVKSFKNKESTFSFSCRHKSS